MRRRLDRAHVPRAAERQVERPRDRRRAQRKHVHQPAQHFELLFVHHAEALLLVNHHQPKILEGDVVLQQPVRADHDVHRPVGKAAHDTLLLPASAKTGKQFNANWIIRHALTENVEMLLRQHGCRHEHGDLLAIQHRLECGANSDFGFAKAYVAAD